MQISLIEFSLENFKAFKNKATFSMVARKNEKYTFETNGENLLKTSLIYGPNASGKTSILEGFELMKRAILFSANIVPENQGVNNLPHFPFLGSEESKDKPTSFEVAFSLSGEKTGIYKYSFSTMKDHVISEKFVELVSAGKEKEYLKRDEKNITVKHDFESMRGLLKNIRKGTLFLSASAQFNNPFAITLINAFNNITTFSNVINNALPLTIQRFKNDPEFQQNLLSRLKTADFNIVGGNIQEVAGFETQMKFEAGKPVTLEHKDVKNDMLLFNHPVFDLDNKEVDNFKLNLFQESMGTQKFASILGPIDDALKNGKVLLVDEFDNSLHPLLTKFIMDLFTSEEINNKNAQFIATTHDTSLLSYKDDFLKDQFWFTEKDAQGSAKLFSLAEFNMRNDTEYSRKYLEGRFGALPFIGSVKK